MSLIPLNELTAGKVIPALASMIGVVAGIVIKYLLGRGKQKSSDNEAITDRWMDLQDYTEDKLKEAVERNESLKDEIFRLKEIAFNAEKNLGIYESSHMSIPLPFWIKDMKGQMIAFNQSYIDEILTPADIIPSEYLTKSDSEIFGIEAAKVIAGHEEIVKRTKKKLEGSDIIGNFKYEWVKYPIFKNNEMIAQAGLVIRVTKNE